MLGLPPILFNISGQPLKMGTKLFKFLLFNGLGGSKYPKLVASVKDLVEPNILLTSGLISKFNNCWGKSRQFLAI